MSRIVTFPHNSSLLASCSGDGTLRVWNFSQGKELCRRSCSEDAGVVSSVVRKEAAEEENGNGNKEAVDDETHQESPPAVRGIKLLSKEGSAILAVIVQG